MWRYAVFSPRPALVIIIWKPGNQEGELLAFCFFLGSWFPDSSRFASDKSATELLGGDVRALFGDGAFHEENEKDEHSGDAGEDEEAVEVGQGGRLLEAEIGQGLQGQLLR